MKTVKDFQYLWSLGLHWTERRRYWEEDNWTSDDIVAYLAWEDENHPNERLTLSRSIANQPETKKEKVKVFFKKVSDALYDFWQSTIEFYASIGKGILFFFKVLGITLYIVGKFMLIVGIFLSPALVSMILVQALGLNPLWYLLNLIYLLLLPVIYYFFNK